MTRKMFLVLLLAASLCPTPRAADDLAAGFANPPEAARAWTYWWWLNGCVTRDGITRELDLMKTKGIGGALVFHAGSGETPFQTEFMSPAWRELFKFAVQEAAKRGIVIGFNVCGGWNAGGPWVKPEEAAQTFNFKAVVARGPKQATLTLIEPKPVKTEYYKDIAVLAWRFTVPVKGEPALCRRDSMVDLTAKLKGDELNWDIPAGAWVVVRFGHYVSPRARTKCTGGTPCLEIDPLRANAMDRHFAATAGVLIEDVKEHAGAGKTFQFLHIDSGEIGKPDWTPAFREEFQRRRGYDPFPYLAARANMRVDSPELTERFNEDYERTLGELMVENYYGRLGVLARRAGLGTHSEAAGFQKPCVDALASLGCNDICMSEFWVRRSNPADFYIHQLGRDLARNHDGIKTAAAAAHTYGRKIVQAEAWTVMNAPPGIPNYDKGPYDLKDTGDRAFCAGLNRAMLCFMVSQPDENARPGYEWPKVGTEFNRHVTWWSMGEAWLTYLARCQNLLQAGEFVADACYFNGEWVPNYVPARWAMNPELPAGYDCDTLNAEILGQAKAEDGKLALAGGMRYAYLVLGQGGRWRNPPALAKLRGVKRETEAGGSNEFAVSPATLKNISALVEGGITLVGPLPARAIGLSDNPNGDREVASLTAALWGARPAASGEKKRGKGRVIWGKSLKDVFAADGLAPDLEIRESAASAALTTLTLNGIPNPYGSFDWIHRRVNGAECYFIANLRSAPAAGEFVFRVAGRQPELWDPVTGQVRPLPEYRFEGDRTRVPLAFAARQSVFVVFRSPISSRPESGPKNFPDLKPFLTLDGPWQVSFDPKWGGPPDPVTFDRLTDWTQRPEPGIKYYSGTAIYKKTFDLPDSALRTPRSALYLDLGRVRNLARVRLNGADLGVVWTAPWRVEIKGNLKPGPNELAIEVVNLWPNRLIGDAGLPPERRLTVTNVAEFKADRALLASGLWGPVTLLEGR